VPDGCHLTNATQELPVWYFVSPQIVFGEGALDALDELPGQRALIVTDAVLVGLGLADRVQRHLAKAGIESRLFAEVEPDPSVETVRRGAGLAEEWQPDAAKAIWVLYERPDLDPAEISPMTTLGLRRKARLVTIPTTSGTGAEATWAMVLTDTAERRKMGLGNRDNLADLAIVDPTMSAGQPSWLTADTGLDALVHAIEGYTCAWHTDFTDGLCLNAVRLVFAYLPRAVADGTDMEARERMANAAAIAGLGMGNSMCSLAHALGHVLGAVFHVPHGRAVGMFLPYTIEFSARQAPERFTELAAYVRLSLDAADRGSPAGCGPSLAARVRDLAERIGNPLTIAGLGIERSAFEAELEKMVDDAFNDTQIVTAVRAPTYEELEQLYLCAYDGRRAEF
jgi:alcohol dehydrogenase class IV